MKKRLMELKKLFQNHGIRWKRWRGLVTVLAMVVVFVTTYALILPAITLEKDQGKPEQGVYLDPMERGSTAALKNEEKTDQPEESTSLGTGTQADQTENTDETAFSRGSQDDGSDTEGKNADGGLDQGQKTAYAQGVYTGKGDGLTVSMDLTEEMRLPADVTVSVKEIMENEESVELGIDYQACLTAAKKAAAREGRGKITAVRFFKFALLSGDKEVRIDQDIDILVKPLEKDLVRKGDQAHVLVFRGSAASMIEDIKTQMSGYRVSAYRFLYPSIAGNSNWGLIGFAVTGPKTEEEENLFSTEETASTETAASTEETASTETAASTEETASTETAPASTEAMDKEEWKAGKLEYDGEGYKVIMTYDEKAAIPEGAVLQVTEIGQDNEDYEKYLKEAGEALELDENVKPAARFFDIKIMNGEKEIEPKAQVSVQILYDQSVEHTEDEEVNALHFGEEKTEVIKDVEIETDERENIKSVIFGAGAFSVYGVVGYKIQAAEDDYEKLTYEDSKILVSVHFKKGIVPEGASLKVTEIIPKDHESADTYAEAITALSDTLKKENQGLSGASVYDLTILDKSNKEIEPEGEVSVSFKYKTTIELNNSKHDSVVQMAHVKDPSEDEEKKEVEIIDTSIDTNAKGDIAQVDFTTDSFSIYVLYSGSSVTSNNIEMPITGNAFGWISFVDPGTGNGGLANGSLETQFPLGSEDGFKRAVQIKFYKLNNGAAAKNANGEIITENYTEMTVPESYFWTWQNSFTIENYDLKAVVNGNQRTSLELVGTRFKTAWAEQNMPEEHIIESDSLIGSYAVRGIQSADQTSYSLNTLDVYLEESTTPWIQNTDMRYVVEYVHADGSRSEGKVKRMGSGGSVSINAANYVRSGEKYAGITVGTGYEAVSVNKAAGTATISYNSSVPLVKVTVYYQKAEESNAERVTPYDKDTKYDNSRLGLHTDKKVTKTSDRDYELTFETWNIIENAADVAMILDASGSMAWAAGNETTGALTPITVDTSKLSGTYTKYNNPDSNQGKLYNWNANSPSYLSYDDVNKILNTHYTDNSKLNYSGYSYYVYCAYGDISEYVALGYSNFGAGTYQQMTSVNNNNFPILVQQYDGNGWYFADTTGNPQYLYNGYKYSNKDYVGISADGQNNWQSPFNNNNPIKPRFYIGTDGYLHCVYYKNNYNAGTFGNSSLWESIVYEKTPTSKTKTEVLQDSIAQFTTILKGQMADSKMAMTRFSNNGFDNDGNDYKSRKKLVLLNWTNASENIIGAMNNVATNNGAAISNGQYNFTLTGGTVTKWGVQSYIKNIQNQITGEDADDRNNKYIIIFTDGKDTGGDADSSNGGETGNLIRNNNDSLVKQGYTVFTVLMRSKAMTEGSDQLTKARRFLRYLATGNQSNDTENGVQKYFEADADDPTGMVEAFRQIALSITSLEGYTIQDYVDPRFNVLNSAGEILSVLDADGNFTNGKTGSERIDWSTTGRQFTAQDGKSATLYYDKNKKMFYIQWTNQRIYSNALGEAVVHPWGSTVRLQAKEDFIGGNDIVTNGDEEKQNRVYHPSFPNNGVTDPKHPAKDFPRTAVNVALLDLDSAHYEDTVFLGETIKPKDRLAYLQGTVDRNEYIEFLSRAGSRDHVDYLSQLAAGREVAVDYRYLGSSNSSLYAGIDQQDDVIGKLVYKWVPVNESGMKRDPDPGNESSGWTSNAGFVSDKTQDYRYKLTIRYVPAEQNRQVSVTLSDGSTTTLHTRDSELREYVPLNSTIFAGANEVTKQPVGNTVSEKTTDSLAVIHVVDGRIHIEKKLNKQELLEYMDVMTQDEMDFIFHLKKDSTQDYRMVTLKLRKQGTATNPANIDTTSSNITIVLTKNSIQNLQETDGKVSLLSLWLTNLPKGEYTLSETINGSNEYILDSLNIVTDYTEEGYASAEDLTKFMAEASEGDETAAWKIGNVPVNTQQQYLDCLDGNVSFPINLVQDLIKHVDPGLSTNSGKIYLNAQIGEAVLENKLQTGSFTVHKVDSKNTDFSLEGVEFTLYKAIVNGDTWTKSDQYGSPQTTQSEHGQPLALASFSGLFPGKYLLFETKAKEGYILPANPWRITVTKSNGSVETTVADSEGNPMILEEGVVTITNEAGAELPSTGGPGTTALYLLGIMLTSLAGACLVMRKRRKAA